MKVLLVEDDISARRLTEQVLRLRGHEVTAVADAEAALATCQAETFPLNVLDWILPGMDGLELCRRLRALPGGEDSLILVTTGRRDPKALRETLDAGADDYLPKPIQMETLNIRLEIAEQRLRDLAARKKADEALERLHRQLEATVEDRTRDLRDSNDALRREIVQRKQAEENARLRQQQLVQADKLIALGSLVSGVAHEINNPNQFIASHIAPLRQAWEGARPILERYYDENGDFLLGGASYSELRHEVPEMFSAVLQGSQRIKTIVDELRQFAMERPTKHTEPLQLNRVVRSASSLLSSLLKNSTERFSVDLDDDLPLIVGDYQRLEQVIINLVQNACQAMANRNGGIKVSTQYNSEERTVVLRIEDEGIGIPTESLDRIMDPFFTTKRASGGTGLGLSISSAILAEHGGTLDFSSTLGQGTTATVVLPAAAATRSAEGGDDGEK